MLRSSNCGPIGVDGERTLIHIGVRSVLLHTLHEATAAGPLIVIIVVISLIVPLIISLIVPLVIVVVLVISTALVVASLLILEKALAFA
jgi:hypothetical protein